MGEVDFPPLRGAHAPPTHLPSATANMVAQRWQVPERQEEDENPTTIGQQAAENGQSEDTARWAAVERRLDQADRAKGTTCWRS